jgi:hypothetical protein
MKCKKRLVLAAFLGAALLPLAAEAQQGGGCYWSRSTNYYTITRQQTSYYTYLQAQQQYAFQQQQTILQQQQTQLSQNRGNLQQNSTLTPAQRTALQMQQQQLVQSKTVLSTQTTQLVCNKTTPQILQTGSVVNRTTLAQQQTALTQQCSHLTTQHTALAQGRTRLAQQSTASPVNRTSLAQNHTQLAQQHTVLQQQSTQLQSGTQYKLMVGRQTTTSTETIKVTTENSCMQCHHGSQPTGVATAQHSPRMPAQPLPGRMPQMAQQQPGRFPLLGPQQPPYPLAMQRAPQLPWLTGGQAPPLLARQPQMPLALGQPLPPALPSAMPLVKFMDLPVAVGKADPTTSRTKLDPLDSISRATTKQPVTLARLPIALEGASGLRGPTKGLDMFDQLTGAQPQRPTATSDIQVFVLPMSDEDLQQPPPRILSAAVIQLSPAAPLPDAWHSDLDQEWLLPVLPTSEPLSKGDPLEMFGSTHRPAPGATQPVPPRPVVLPEAPGKRAVDLLPG